MFSPSWAYNFYYSNILLSGYISITYAHCVAKSKQDCTGSLRIIRDSLLTKLVEDSTIFSESNPVDTGITRKLPKNPKYLPDRKRRCSVNDAWPHRNRGISKLETKISQDICSPKLKVDFRKQ